MGNGAISAAHASHTDARLCPLCFHTTQEERRECGECTSSNQDVDDDDQLQQIHFRPASVASWLSHWELSSLAPLLASFAFRSCAQVTLLTAAHHERIAAFLKRPNNNNNDDDDDDDDDDNDNDDDDDDDDIDNNNESRDGTAWKRARLRAWERAVAHLEHLQQATAVDRPLGHGERRDTIQLFNKKTTPDMPSLYIDQIKPRRRSEALAGGVEAPSPAPGAHRSALPLPHERRRRGAGRSAPGPSRRGRWLRRLRRRLRGRSSSSSISGGGSGGDPGHEAFGGAALGAGAAASQRHGQRGSGDGDFSDEENGGDFLVVVDDGILSNHHHRRR